jgi:hypothetical protein
MLIKKSSKKLDRIENQKDQRNLASLEVTDEKVNDGKIIRKLVNHHVFNN